MICLFAYCILFCLTVTSSYLFQSKLMNCKTMSLNSEMAEDAFGAPVGPLPISSSKVNWGDQTPKDIRYDMWIVGAGTLGREVVKLYKEKYPLAKIVSETATNSSHEYLQSLGAIPRLRNERSDEELFKSKNVLICIPPSAKGDDYITEISLACGLWAGPLGGGQLVFTSSTAVYGDAFGFIVNEKFRVDTRTSRASKMNFAEQAVLDRDGCVIRLAGLYSEMRGAHSFWIGKGSVDASPNGYINMLHYEDAAAAVIAVHEKGQAKGIYLVCDDEPLTRKEICEVALQSGLYPNIPMPTFLKNDEPISKICDDSWTRKSLDWHPKYLNFGQAMITMRTGQPFNLNRPSMKPQVLPGIEEVNVKETPSGLWIPGVDDDEGFTLS